MTVERGWHVEFDEEQIERLEGESFPRILSRPSGREDWAAALADARELVAAGGGLGLPPGRGIRHDRVLLDGGASLGGGPVAAVVSGAAELVLAICTIGPGLGKRVQELQHDRHMLRGLLLDDLGTWAVDMVRQQLCRRMEDEAAARRPACQHLPVPGRVGVALQDQRVIFSLLEASASACR